MIKYSMDQIYGLNSKQYELLKYLIVNQDKGDLVELIDEPNNKLNELLKYISYMSDFEKYCFLIYHNESSDFIGELFEDAIENILSMKLSKQQRDKIEIKRPDEYFPVKYDIDWFLKKYGDTFLPYGIHDLMLNDTYYFRRDEISNPSIYNYFYFIFESAKSNINKDSATSESERSEAHNNLNIIVNNFETKYNPIRAIRF